MNLSAVDVKPQAGRPAEEIETTSVADVAFDRRHDLDALRAIAMLLGIVLHAAISFAPIPWPVSDTQQSEFYLVLFSLIHGFRMPLFFMLSGFFTAMLWRKRGLRKLVQHRLKRILLPLVIGCFTIVPSMWLVSYIVTRPAPGSPGSSPIFAAVVAGDVEQVRLGLQDLDVEVDAIDANSGSSPLCTAVFLGHTEIVEALLDAGADVSLPNRDKATPLHIACFMGRSQAAALLMNAGADANALDGTGLTARQVLETDFGTTNFIASSLGVPLDEAELMAGRTEIAGLLGAAGSEVIVGGAGGMETLEGLLFQLPVFLHLWFLWFLCWLVVAFVGYAFVAKLVRIERLPRWLICSPVGLLWLIPLTMFPQSLMQTQTFGPDPSVGMLPIPSVLAYYAVFFFFGAIYWDMDDSQGRLGRWWYVSLPVALCIVFPVGLDLVSGTFGIVPRFVDQQTNIMLGNFLQAAFAWLMTFGSIGLCRRLLSRESRTLRYLSDSSYWLYLVHLPLVILAQWYVREMNLPVAVKFVGITVVVSSLLVVSYEYGVRYTLIGQLLNGPRTRST